MYSTALADWATIIIVHLNIQNVLGIKKGLFKMALDLNTKTRDATPTVPVLHFNHIQHISPQDRYHQSLVHYRYDIVIKVLWLSVLPAWISGHQFAQQFRFWWVWSNVC